MRERVREQQPAPVREPQRELLAQVPGELPGASGRELEVHPAQQVPGVSTGVSGPVQEVLAEQAVGEPGSPLTGTEPLGPRVACSPRRTTRPSQEPEKPRQTCRK